MTWALSIFSLPVLTLPPLLHEWTTLRHHIIPSRPQRPTEHQMLPQLLALLLSGHKMHNLLLLLKRCCLLLLELLTLPQQVHISPIWESRARLNYPLVRRLDYRAARPWLLGFHSVGGLRLLLTLDYHGSSLIILNVFLCVVVLVRRWEFSQLLLLAGVGSRTHRRVILFSHAVRTHIVSSSSLVTHDYRKVWLICTPLHRY